MPSNALPSSVSKYFWGDDLSQLDWQHHQPYICQTILERGDVPAVEWLFNTMSQQELATQLPSLHLSNKSRNFWSIYLS